MRNSSLLLIALIILLTVTPWGTPGNAEPTTKFQVIPDEAIRLRILADSNSEKDQQLKRQVRDQVNAEITKWVDDLTSVEAARQLIQERIDDVGVVVAEAVEDSGLDQTHTVEYGQNVKFPTKLYGSYIYPAGEYEAILITLGAGEGDNWWCVLFPPLCFLDFSNGTSVAEVDQESTEPEVENEQDEDTEVKFFLVQLWENIIS